MVRFTEVFGGTNLGWSTWTKYDQSCILLKKNPLCQLITIMLYFPSHYKLDLFRQAWKQWLKLLLNRLDLSKYQLLFVLITLLILDIKNRKIFKETFIHVHVKLRKKWWNVSPLLKKKKKKKTSYHLIGDIIVPRVRETMLHRLLQALEICI